jgi:hypothetical protein
MLIKGLFTNNNTVRQECVLLCRTNFAARQPQAPQPVALPWRRGAVDIAHTSGTEDPRSNPARVFFRKIVAMLLSITDLISIVCVRRYLINKGVGHKNIKIKMLAA